ncbi:MAG: polysaccharide biosynthesis protein [Aeromicrobium sp.]|nr:polysaccharide biosynthesis protein [Aeromicrobium sp.]
MEWVAAVRRIRTAYRDKQDRRLRLLAPRRYSEKIQWRKAFDMNPLFGTLCDKLAVRDYIVSRVGYEYVIPLLWSGGPTAHIPFDALEPPYVVKSSHASGHVAFVTGHHDVKVTELRRRTVKWMAQTYGDRTDEPGYDPVPPRLMVERMLAGPSGERPDERRLFVFDGKVAVINTVFIEDGQVRADAFHTPDWARLDWSVTRKVDREFVRPDRLDDMIRVAEELGRGLDHVRVDLYDCGDRFHVGEVTLYSWGGHARFNPDEADLLLGAHWNLKKPMRRAVRSVLFGRRRIGQQPGHSVTNALR